MALELSRPEADNPEDEARRAAAERRAVQALESLLGQLTTPSDDVAPAHAEHDDDIVDIRDDAPAATLDEPWVSVADAAAHAGVSTSTVRQWYRSGRLATQRREGERGGFLVPLEDVVRLANLADDAGDAVEDSVIDINASYWAAETEAAREAEAAARADADEARTEARRLSADLDDAREQIEAAREQLRSARADAAAAEKATAEVEHEISFLRSQLSEAHDELRELRATTAKLEAQLQAAQRAATFGSVTSTEWVDEVDHGYRGALRPQNPTGEAGDESADAGVAVPQYEIVEDEAEDVDPLALLSLGLPPIVYGEAEDDLLPVPEVKPAKARSRRRR